MALKRDSAVKQQVLIHFPLSSTTKEVLKAFATYFMILAPNMFCSSNGQNENLSRELRLQNGSLRVKTGLVVDM